MRQALPTWLNYGLPGDYPVVGGMGMGQSDLSDWDVLSAQLQHDGFAEIVFAFGAAGDQPIAGGLERGWSGHGQVYRNGTFYLRNNTAGAAG
jgi:hypothetical protein